MNRIPLQFKAGLLLEVFLNENLPYYNILLYL